MFTFLCSAGIVGAALVATYKAIVPDLSDIISLDSDDIKFDN